MLVPVLLLVAGLAHVQKHPSGNVAPTSASTVPTPPESNWHIDESTDSMDGVKTTVITNGHGDQVITIRFRGKSLDAYVATPEIVDEDAVRVRFDDGKPISQAWSTRSTDYRAVFSPNPHWLVAKLQTSKKFYIEYHAKVPQMLSFDVAGLVVPKGLLDAHDKQR